MKNGLPFSVRPELLSSTKEKVSLTFFSIREKSRNLHGASVKRSYQPIFDVLKAGLKKFLQQTEKALPPPKPFIPLKPPKGCRLLYLCISPLEVPIYLKNSIIEFSFLFKLSCTVFAP